MQATTRKFLLISLFCLMAIVFGGITYAFFTAVISTGDRESSIIVQTGSLKLVYSDDEYINLSGVMPGTSTTKTITVTNEGINAVNYDLVWISLTNNFVVRKDLVMQMTCTSSIDSCDDYPETIISFGGNNVPIKYRININAGEVQTYNVVITFKETGSNQNDNQGKNIIGKIGILESDLYSSNILKYKASNFMINNLRNSSHIITGLTNIDIPSTDYMDAHSEYRYQGGTLNNDEPSNYILFNDELWRIIGIFPVDNGTGTIENRLKIIRNTPIGNYSYDVSPSYDNQGYGYNNWATSDIMKLLNPGYESETIGGSLY